MKDYEQYNNSFIKRIHEGSISDIDPNDINGSYENINGSTDNINDISMKTEDLLKQDSSSLIYI